MNKNLYNSKNTKCTLKRCIDVVFMSKVHEKLFFKRLEQKQHTLQLKVIHKYFRAYSRNKIWAAVASQIIF